MKGSEEFNFPYAVVNYSLRIFDMTDKIQFDIFFVEAAIMNEQGICQSLFYGIVKPIEINKSYDKDVQYFETKVNEHGAIVYNDSVELYCVLEKFLDKASISHVYTLSNRKLDLSSVYLNLCQSNIIHILRNITYMQEAIGDQIVQLGFNLCREHFPYSVLFQLFHIDRTCNTDKIPDKLNNLNHLLIAFRKGIELNEYDKSYIQTYCEKESPYQYTELNAYLKRKSILKAINIAGCAYNLSAYIKNLKIAHFKECEIEILKEYYSIMRYEYTLYNNSNWLKQNILTSPPLYPTLYIKKQLGDELYETAEQLTQKVKTEKKYISALKNNSFLEAQIPSALRLFYNKNIIQRECHYKDDINNRLLLESKNNYMKESYNASKAKKNGMFTEDEITQEKLEKFGFAYSVDFFIWLRKKKYIVSREIHHINNQGNWKNVYFYDDSSLTYIVDKIDLEFLYKIYTNQINYEDALKIKNITFCKVKAIPEIIGIKTGEPVIINCVRQDNTFWFSHNKYIEQQNNNITVLSSVDIKKEPNSKKYNKIAKKLISYKCRKIKKVLI